MDNCIISRGVNVGELIKTCYNTSILLLGFVLEFFSYNKQIYLALQFWVITVSCLSLGYKIYFSIFFPDELSYACTSMPMVYLRAVQDGTKSLPDVFIRILLISPPKNTPMLLASNYHHYASALTYATGEPGGSVRQSWKHFK